MLHRTYPGGGDGRRHIGLWLSVYDTDGIDVEALQARLDRPAEEALGAST